LSESSNSFGAEPTALPLLVIRANVNWRPEIWLIHKVSFSRCEVFIRLHLLNLQQSFPSQVQVILPFVDQLMRFILNFRFADGSEVDIEMALREALANAVVHGNGESPGKRVYVECRCYTDEEVSITVRDEGPGFDTGDVADPTTPENRLFKHGRGIYIMKTLMDEVFFEQSGTVLHMRKKPNVGSAAPKRVE